MDLSDRERIELLGHAVRLMCRSFAEYIGESAPPFDIDEHPEVARTLHEVVAAKRAAADRLVEAVETFDTHPDLTVAFDPRFTYYNYMTTAYALKVLAEHLERSLAAAEALAKQARGDAYIGDLLDEVVASERANLARVEELRRPAAPAAAPA